MNAEQKLRFLAKYGWIFRDPKKAMQVLGLSDQKIQEKLRRKKC